MTTRRSLTLAIIGCALVALAMIAVVLVIVDKPRFGGLVNPSFLPAVASGVIVGGLFVLVAAWNFPRTPPWRRWFLIAWALIAVSSPAFGIMFLLPWSALVLMLPLVIVILAQTSPVPA